MAIDARCQQLAGAVDRARMPDALANNNHQESACRRDARVTHARIVGRQRWCGRTADETAFLGCPGDFGFGASVLLKKDALQHRPSYYSRDPLAPAMPRSSFTNVAPPWKREDDGAPLRRPVRHTVRGPRLARTPAHLRHARLDVGTRAARSGRLHLPAGLPVDPGSRSVRIASQSACAPSWANAPAELFSDRTVS